MRILNFEHLEQCFVILHLVSVSQNVKISPFEQNITDRQTDTQTHRHTDTIHTSLSLTLSVFREHNSPSGKHIRLRIKHRSYGRNVSQDLETEVKQQLSSRKFLQVVAQKRASCELNSELLV